MTASHPYTDEMIQSFVAGTLDADSVAELERAAATNPALAAELALWRSVRQAGADAAAQRQVDALGWSRIARSIANAAPQQSRAANDHGADRALLRKQPLWARPLIAPWQAAAALVLALVGWQAVMAPVMISKDPSAGAEYALAGEDRSASFVLRVAFVEVASEADLRQLLREVDARIIDGPSAVGLYDLAFDDAEALTAARQRLEKERGLVSEVAAK
jgi:anti-sigma factor RsiW